MPDSTMSTRVLTSWRGGSAHSDRLASSGQIAVDVAPAPRSTRRARSAIRRESAPPLQSSTTSSGRGWRAAACSSIPLVMNPAHNLSSRVVLPVPVVPSTTWCERSRGYGRTASGRAGWRTVRIVAPATTLPSRSSNGTEPGAVIRARAVRT